MKIETTASEVTAPGGLTMGVYYEIRFYTRKKGEDGEFEPYYDHDKEMPCLPSPSEISELMSKFEYHAKCHKLGYDAAYRVFRIEELELE